MLEKFFAIKAARLAGRSSEAPCSSRNPKQISNMQPIFAVALLAAMVAIASSAPQGGEPPVPILSSQFDQKEDGSYSFSYETGDGIKRSENGEQKKIGEESGSTSNGSISWKTPEGKTVTITFVADERGFQPKVTVS